MKLVIVESPTKARTLSGILGKDYDIKASMGHIRDLPKKELGVDVDHNFEPQYEVPSKAKKVISELKKDVKKSDSVILATDPDREGEAIAWHLKELLSNGKSKKSPEFERVVFHELTKEAVEEAFDHKTKLNMDLVDAQQARRVLDRLVGYKLSPLLWKKVRYGLSAGRVQSVAVRLVVERERERDAFDPEEYWTIDGEFETAGKDVFVASLEKKAGKKLNIKNEKQSNSIQKDLDGDKFSIGDVKKSERKRKPYAPFKTSTLQQTSANLFGMSAKRTMSAAQRLFEEGLITYHRTDSLNLSPQFINSARGFIKGAIGNEYIPAKGIYYKTKSKGAQEAHEAIRPTNVKTITKDLKSKKLKKDDIKVYSLIWKRALECQMKPAIYDQTTILVESDKGYTFKATGSVIKFDGWLAVGKFMGLEDDGNGITVLPDVEENDSVELNKLVPEQHFTQPPGRYTDASLIKAMEDLGVGRPSTYAPTISTILARGYVSREGRSFVPEDVAYVVTDLLVEHFPIVIDYEFTAGMEEKLDEIADGEVEWAPVIKEFYGPFDEKLEKKEKELKKSDVTTLEKTDEKCPKCGRQLNIKLGKYGKFLSCSGFPECDYAKPLETDTDENGEEVEDYGVCEKCGEGKMILKQGRFGKFLACNRYPDCKNTKPYLDKIGMKCPKCGEGEVIVKKAKGRTFYGCSRYPDCDYASWKNPLEQKESGENDGDTQGEDDAE